MKDIQSMSITSAFSADPFRWRSFRRNRTVLRILDDRGPATSGRGRFCYATLCLFLCSLRVALALGLPELPPFSQSAVGMGFNSLKKDKGWRKKSLLLFHKTRKIRRCRLAKLDSTNHTELFRIYAKVRRYFIKDTHHFFRVNTFGMFWI